MCVKEAMEVLERERLEKVNVTEPDSRLINGSRAMIQPSHNGQIAVDDKEQVIMAADIRKGCHRIVSGA